MELLLLTNKLKDLNAKPSLERLRILNQGNGRLEPNKMGSDGEMQTLSTFIELLLQEKKRNTIAKLRIGGNDVFDQTAIKEDIRNYYINLFSDNNNMASSFDAFSFPQMGEENKEWLERNFSKDEVWGVIKNMGSNKSPGPDGFTAEFYKSCWSTIKGNFMRMLNDFYKYGTLDWRLNSSFITLIPKKEDSCTLKILDLYDLYEVHIKSFLKCLQKD